MAARLLEAYVILRAIGLFHRPVGGDAAQRYVEANIRLLVTRRANAANAPACVRNLIVRNDLSWHFLRWHCDRGGRQLRFSTFDRNVGSAVARIQIRN